jgi:RNA polymerase sigma-70 factor, ECF subfamily
MSTMTQPPSPRPCPGDLLAQRILFDALMAVVRRMLGRYGLQGADREEVAQEVAVAAYRGLGKYDADRGTPKQWLSGIVRRQVKSFLRRWNKLPSRAAGDDLPDVPDPAWTPEEEVSLHDLAVRAFSVLPDEERRVVLLIEIERLTLREAAEREGISASTAFERHKRGMAALRDAAGREDQASCGVLVFPLAAGDSAPPPAFVEQAWRRAVVELGLRRLRPPLTLGAVAAAGVACVLGGVLLGRCTAGPQDEGTVAMLAEGLSLPHEGAVPSAIVAAPVDAAPVVDAKPAAIVVVKDDGKGERELLRLARIAIEQRDAARALALLAQVRSTRFAAWRDRLRKSALSVQAEAANP